MKTRFRRSRKESPAFKLALFSPVSTCEFFCPRRHAHVLRLVRIDGVMRTMNTEKLIKTLPIIQNQLDALLDFQVGERCARARAPTCSSKFCLISIPIKM